ncbi:MAG: glycosyltransferase [Candidatus Marinimicrobia bacterium]|nr:glycosyltransferase [Candidatus Neomarinimicrobiota bacterium]
MTKDKPKIRVLHLIGSMGLGGAGKLVKYDVENADPEIFEVGVACLESLGEYGHELLTKGYLVKRFDFSRSWKMTCKNLKALLNLFKFLKYHKVDIVSSHLFIPGILARIYGKILNIHGILHTTHNIMYPRIEPFVDNFLQRFTNKVIVDSNAVKSKLIESGIHSENIEVIYNGIDDREFSQTLQMETEKEALNISSDNFILGNISGLQYYKGHDFLLDIFAQVEAKHKNVHLVLVGDGELKDQLIEQVTDLKLSDKVHFLGKRSDIQSLIAAMDIMVHPARWEGFGIILAEAMYCGVPVVCSDRGGIPEVVQDQVSGFVHPFGDKDAFVGSISALINDNKLRQKMANAGTLRARELFSMKQMMANYSRVYKALVE